MEQNSYSPVFRRLLELFVTGHLIVVEGDFVGDQWAEKYLGVFAGLVLGQEMNLFGKEFRVFFLFSNYWLDFMKSLFDFFVLVGFEEVADNYEETFVGFELLFG